MANSAEPDQLASSETNWSGSTLFAKAGSIQVQQSKGYAFFNPYLAVRDNSRAGGVCQLKSLSYLQYTTCNHSEQVFSYRSEPTFIQTRHFSYESQVLDFTHTKKDREYQISSCH